MRALESSSKHSLNGQNKAEISGMFDTQLVFRYLYEGNLRENLLVLLTHRLVVLPDEVLHELLDVVDQNLK